MSENAPDIQPEDTQATKKGRGRPPAITPEVAKKIFFLAAKGCTDEEVGQILGISYDVIYRAKKDVHFSKAIAESKDEADLMVVTSLFSRALGYSHPETKFFCYEGEIIERETVKHYPPDTAACQLWLMNRRKDEWRKEIQHEETRQRPALIKIMERVSQKEVARVQVDGNQVAALLGPDYVSEVQKAS